VPQLFSRAADTGFRALLLGLVLSVAAALGLLLLLPFTAHVTGQGGAPAQPVQFSHAHHAGELGIDCRYCHTGVEHSSFAGVPPTETCMTCHSQLWTNAEMLAPVRRSLAEDTPLHWVRVHRLPNYVYFDHSIHLATGVGCSTCHGPVQQMQQIRQAAPLTMGWCLACHRDPTPFLRPEAAIFDTSWTPPPDQAERGRALLAHYGIETEHLTDCSRCHR